MIYKSIILFIGVENALEVGQSLEQSDQRLIPPFRNPLISQPSPSARDLVH